MFDFRKIEAFCKVCELRSFSKAGEALFLSQPTVSAHIQALERDFEVRLLDRMGRTVLPTPAGVVLYRYATQAFSHLETARAEIRALSQEVTGDLLIGCSAIPAHHVLPELLAAFKEQHPQVNPSLKISSSASLVSEVRQGRLMAGIVGSYPQADPELVGSLLLESDILVVAPPSSAALPVLKASAQASDGPPFISFETARKLNWIIREQGSTTRKIFESALHAAGYDPRLLLPGMTVDSAHAAVEYVRAGLGVSATVRIAAQEALRRGEVLAYRIAGVSAARQFFCILNSRRVPFPSATVFLKFLQKHTQHLRARQDAETPV